MLFNNDYRYGKVSNQEEADVTGNSNADSILDLLNEDDVNDSKEKDEPTKVKKEDKEEIKLKDDEDDTDDENETEDEDEEGLELKEEDEEELEITVPVSKKTILKKYPNVFKDFPHLEASYYKAQQYTELLPTVEDAKLAVEKANNLDNFEKDILDGNLENLFNIVKTSAPNSFRKIADTLINTLNKVDENVALHVVGNVLKYTLGNAEQAGKDSKDDQLELAAQIINKHLFGKDKIEKPTNLNKENPKNEESDKLNRERTEFETERFNTALNSLQGRIDNTLKATIADNIDKADSMTAYVKKNAVKDAFETVEGSLRKDPSLKRILDSLWKAAREEKYSSSSLDKIRKTYLSKAKVLLPGAIRNARNEALKGIGKASKDSNSDEKSKKGPLPANRSSSSSSSNNGKLKEIPKGMSNRDFLMAD